jgi:hypothetical protein
MYSVARMALKTDQTSGGRDSKCCGCPTHTTWLKCTARRAVLTDTTYAMNKKFLCHF